MSHATFSDSLNFDDVVAARGNLLDLSCVFDEDDINDLFRGTTPDNMTMFDDEMLPVVAVPPSLPQQQQPLMNPPPSKPMIIGDGRGGGEVDMSSITSSTTTVTPQTCPADFVNIVMIVDPNTGMVMCPEQVLAYQVNGNTERVVFGPMILDTVPQDMMNLVKLSASQQQQQLQNSVADIDTEEPFLLPEQGKAATPISPPTTPSSDICSESTSWTMPQAQQAPKALYGSSSIITVPPVSPVSVSPVPSQDQILLPPSTSNAELGLPPLRALSAYNFYFRDERARILHGGEYEWTIEKQQSLLAAHWNQDRTKKRRHRKSHGIIDFTTLSRLISTRWKELDESRKDFYRQVAAHDWTRFQRELDDYKKPESTDDIRGDSNSHLTSQASPAVELFHTVIG